MQSYGFCIVLENLLRQVQTIYISIYASIYQGEQTHLRMMAMKLKAYEATIEKMR